MTADSLRTINMVGEATAGTTVEFVGVVTALRALGKVSFLVVRDTWAEVQVVVTGDLLTMIADQSPAFHVRVSGVVGARPAADVRSDSPNGHIEVRAQALRLLGAGPQPARRPAIDQRLQLTSRLQSCGFQSIAGLATLYAPDFLDLLRGDSALGAAQQLAYMLAPNRWYLLTPDHLYFGACPASIAELKTTLHLNEPPSDAHWSKALAEITWSAAPQEHNDGHAPSAFGSIKCGAPSDSGELVDAVPYWRHRHRVANLGNDLVRLAASPPQLDDTEVRKLQERIERGQALLTAMAGSGKRANIAPILRNLEEFDLHVEHTETMLELFPSLEKKLAGSQGDEQFELLWSILGHDHVKEVFSSPEAVTHLTACVGAGMFSDFNLLRSLNPKTLECIHSLTRGLEDEASVQLISEMFGAAPSASASACSLMQELKQAGAEWQRCAPLAQTGVISRLAFHAAATGAASTDEISAWRQELSLSSRFLFKNDPVNDAACRSALESSADQHPWLRRTLHALPQQGLVFDLIHQTFGYGLVAYDEASRMYEATSDCSNHWQMAGFEFSGDRWNEGEGRFELSDLWLYPSKNRAAILSKSCSGICSARNMGLFHRDDHFQFTLVDPKTLAAAGSLQMYALRDAEGKRTWVVRGLNPSEKAEIDALGFAYEVLDSLATMAQNSQVDTLACADGLGLFSADSSRASLRAILRRAATGAAQVNFGSPLHIFNYHDRPISIEHGWQIWP